MNRLAKAFDWRFLAAAFLGATLLGSPLAAHPAQTPQPQRASQGLVLLGEDPAKQSFLGVNIWEINADVAKKKKLSEERGVVITSVVEGSAAAEAGIRKGDVVVEYNGAEVIGEKQFVRLVQETPVGRQVTMKVVRGSQKLDISATMGSKKQLLSNKLLSSKPFEFPEGRAPRFVIPDVPHISTTWRNPKLGIVGEALDGQLAEYFGVQEGVLVRSVAEDTPAARAGLKAGDVIVKAGATAVASPRQLSDRLQESGSATVPLAVIRKGREMKIDITIDNDSGSAPVLRQMILGGQHSL